MVFSVQLVDRIHFGNLRGRVYKLTDAQSAGSSFNPGLARIRFVRGVNQSDGADTFKEAHTSTVVTVTPVTDDDDGYILVAGE
jgi:hypothetical protein